MTDLQTRLSDANPVNDDDLAPSFEEVWHRFENTTVPERRSSRRLPRTTGARRRRRLARWATIGAAAVAVAVAVLVVGTTSGGPAKAFAGWSADPTTPASGQLQAAESACQKQNPSTASLAPTVGDVRGPYSMLVYVESNRMVDCIAGSQGTLMSGITSPPTASVAPDAITVVAAGNTVIATNGEQSAAQLRSEDDAASVVVGEVGANVTAVTLTLDDGSDITTTVSNGWFASWWPGSHVVQSAEITTASGTSTQPLTVPTLPPSSTPSGGAS